MSAANEFNFSLKVMVNREKDKVLFAEAGADFVLVLLSFLKLPLGKILKLLQKHNRSLPCLDQCLTDLYKGVTNMNSVYFFSEDRKLKLLNPANSLEAECRKLERILDDSEPDEYLSCKKKRLKTTATAAAGACDGDRDVGVFTEKTMPFLISDDLRVLPIVLQGSIIQPLSDFGITDIAKAELRTVTLGYTEIINLLKVSLHSVTPLTDVLISNEHDYGRDNFQRIDCLKSNLMRLIKKEPNMNFKKMTVKSILKKSTRSFLFLLAREDFVDFLFSFLTLSLGDVKYLCNNTSVLAIDNLYRSTTKLNDAKNPKLQGALNSLIKPQLPPKFISRNIVKGPATFMVSDDLTVTPVLSLSSSLSVLNKEKIPLSNIEELELQVGLEEILSILKASFCVNWALTEGLINPIIYK